MSFRQNSRVRRDPPSERTKRIYSYHRRQGKPAQEAYRLAKWQREHRIVGHIGDVNWLQHSGGPIMKDSSGNYSLEYVEPPNGGKKYIVYRVDLDKEPLPKWIDAKKVANTIGSSPGLIRLSWNSANPRKRALAREAVASHYGWFELDQYPLRLTKKEIQTRYRRRA